MKKEITKHFVTLNGNVVAECNSVVVAQILIDSLMGKLVNEKNMILSYQKTTEEIEVEDKKEVKK